MPLSTQAPPLLVRPSTTSFRKLVAAVDGASNSQMMRYVILPLVAPSSILIAIFRLVDALLVIDVVYSLTGGGPRLLDEHRDALGLRERAALLQPERGRGRVLASPRRGHVHRALAPMAEVEAPAFKQAA